MSSYSKVSGIPKYVYVKLSSKKNAAAKKVLLPANLPALKKAVSKIFNLGEAIGGFLDQQEDPIDDIRNIFDGSLIFAVLKSKMDNASFVSSSVSISLEQSSKIDESQSRGEIKSNASTPQIIINGKGSAASKASTPSVKFELQTKKNQVTPKSANINRNKAQKKKCVDYDDDDYDEDYDDLDNSYSEDEIEYRTEGEELMKLALNKYEADVSTSINEAFYALLPETKDFLAEAIKMENIQKSRYFNKLLKTCKEYGIFDYNEEWIHLDKMVAKAKSLICDHRYPFVNGYIYVMKTAILGPDKSGKSTFLHVYFRELLIDLIATDSWKNTFIFPYDIELFMEGMIDLKHFYKEYIRYIFDLLRIQCPAMTPLIPCIEQCFESITEMKGHVVLPRKLTQRLEYKKLTAALDEITSLLAKVWYDPEQFEVWIGNLAILPKRLATAFGFKQVIHIYDHFDTSNTNIEPSRPFFQSEYASFPSELLKCALIQGPFILGSKKCDNFFDSLESIDENILVNLKNYVDIFYLWDLIDTSLYSNKEIYVEFAVTKTQLKITSYACGGIPNYLIKWNKMNKMFDELEKLKENTPDYEDAYCELVTIIEVIVFELFTSENEAGTKMTVANVRRRSIE